MSGEGLLPMARTLNSSGSVAAEPESPLSGERTVGVRADHAAGSRSRDGSGNLPMARTPATDAAPLLTFDEAQKLAAEIKPLIDLATGWGHGPGSEPGTRIAGFYYRNEDAKKANVMPAHTLSLVRELVNGLTTGSTP